MTLCVTWVRQAGDNRLLVFATDSTLTGGKKWNMGIKLFDLPRLESRSHAPAWECIPE
jgi:hypothetical protein